MIKAVRRPARSRRLEAGTLLLFSLSCGRATGPKVDSESHFLGGCATSCAAGLSCVCGVCTLSCAEATDCGGVAPSALCRALDAAQCGSTEASVCDVACAGTDDCGDVPGASCSGGWCRAPRADATIGGGDPLAAEGSSTPGADVSESGRNDSSPAASASDPNDANAGLSLELPSAYSDGCGVAGGSVVTTQEALATFEGCENIFGDLEITFSADLRPLHALRNLFGTLYLHPATSTQRSLEGLEALELVQGDLRLTSLELASLASLARLQSVGAEPGQGLVLDKVFTLQALNGLEQLANLHSLTILDAPDLLSIAALHLPLAMERIVLGDVPLLSSIESSSVIARLDALTLENTGLESLGLALPREIAQLAITDNALLTDTSALLGLQALRRLNIDRNARLTNIVFPQQASSLDSLSVDDNPQLGTLALFTLQALQNLEVLRNSSLTSIELPLLAEPVQSLVVVSNASLPPDSLRPLMQGAVKAKIAGNQGDTTGLAPCPFKRDGFCDSPPTDTLCAPNTDLFDCSSAH